LPYNQLFHPTASFQSGIGKFFWLDDRASIVNKVVLLNKIVKIIGSSFYVRLCCLGLTGEKPRR